MKSMPNQHCWAITELEENSDTFLSFPDVLLLLGNPCRRYLWWKNLERMGLLFYKLQTEDAVHPQKVWLLFGRGLSLMLAAAQCPAQTSVLWHRHSVFSPFCSWASLSAQQPSLLLCMIGLFRWTRDHVYSWSCVKGTALVKKPLIITPWLCSGVVGLCAALWEHSHDPWLLLLLATTMDLIPLWGTGIWHHGIALNAYQHL